MTDTERATAVYHLARWLAGGVNEDYTTAAEMWPDLPITREAAQSWLEDRPEVADAVARVDPAGPPPEPDGWKVYTVADAYAPRPPITYLVNDLLPLPSLSVVYAPPGDFKTMLMADMAACVAAGEPWLPSLPGKLGNVQRGTTQAGVLWADFDNGPRTMHERIEAVARDRDLTEDAPLYYVSMPNPWLDASDFDSILELADLIERLGVDLVIIDNLRDVSGRVDENSAEMGNVMSHFRRLAEDTETALVIIHHQRKANGFSGRAGDALRGHSSIEAAIDLALLIEREEYADSVKVKATKSRGADVYPFGAVFTYDHKPGTTELAAVRFYGQEVEDLTSDPAIRRAILEEVKSDPGINKGDLTEAVKERLGDEPGLHRIRQQIDYLAGEGKLAMEVGAYNAHCYSISAD